MIPLLLAAEVVAGTSLIALLIWLIVLAVVVWLLFLIIGMLPIPEPIKTIITVVIALILLLVIVQRLGFL
jgi:hypothetical protein